MSSSSDNEGYESSLDSSKSDFECNTSSEFFPSESDSDVEDTDDNYLYPVTEYEWRSARESGDCTPPPFTSMPALKVNINSNSPLEMFEILFNSDLVDMILTETNKVGNNLSQSLKDKYQWRKITPNEVKIMVTTLIAQQLSYMIFLYRQPGYNESRITLIYKLLSFTSDPNARTAMLKAKPAVDLIRNRFKEVYTPRQKIIVDERMTFMTKGPISRRNCHGLSSYVLSESLSGYIYNFIIHLAEPTLDKHDFNTGYKIDVLYSLMEGLFGKGYHLYTMNYYNSLEMAVDMYEKQTGFVGSVRNKLRNIPNDLRDQILNVGEGAHRYEKSGKMVLMKWNSRKNSYVVSTVHNGEETAEVMKKKIPTVIPKLIADYESADENVEFEDCCLESFHFEQSKCSVTYRRIFRHVLNLVVSNAHALHMINGGTLKYTKFKMELCNALVERYL